MVVVWWPGWIVIMVVWLLYGGFGGYGGCIVDGGIEGWNVRVRAGGGAGSEQKLAVNISNMATIWTPRQRQHHTHARNNQDEDEDEGEGDDDVEK